jgi:hypothetical protein
MHMAMVLEIAVCRMVKPTADENQYTVSSASTTRFK